MNKSKFISFNENANSKIELAIYSIGSDYPLEGCSSAEPSSVLFDQINIQRKIKMIF